MDKLLPDLLKELWGRVERKQLTVTVGEYQQARLLDDYRAIRAVVVISTSGLASGPAVFSSLGMGFTSPTPTSASPCSDSASGA
jgi:hypothetical protein